MDPRRLREATRPEHEATEATLPLMDPGLTRQRYAHVLGCLYPVVQGWEQWAERHAPPELRAFVAARHRAPALAEDLSFLDPLFAKILSQNPKSSHRAFDPQSIPGLHPPNATPGFQAAFLGAMYVIEGSRLGGQFIATHVEQTLHLQPGHGNAYFRGYGDHTGSMWKSFQSKLIELPDETTEVAILAAKAMFKVFGQALTECTPA
jgi:heme oxygenase (biliverdin-IX-beta and delta-forming)